MFNYIIKKIVGSQNDRKVKKMRPTVAKINEIEATLKSLSDDDLRQKVAAWKAELSQIQDDDELSRRIDEILPEVYAVGKNACRRLCGQGDHCPRPRSEMGDGALRCPIGRRHRSSQRQDR